MNPEDVGNFLSRWSRRKLGTDQPAAQPQPVVETPATAAANCPNLPEPSPEPPPEALPPVESLTPDSDFKPFMRPDVEPGLKQAAMKRLFKDPHFNVMDGLDTYIDDYTQADPIPASMLEELMQRRVFFSPPPDEANLSQRAGDELAPDPGAISAVSIAPPSAAVASAPPMAQSPVSPPSTNVPPVSATIPERPIVASTPAGIEATAGAKADEK